MYYVGIDVAKQTHYAAVMNSDGYQSFELPKRRNLNRNGIYCSLC